MGRLTCHCLNVSVHYKGGNWDSRPVLAAQLFPEGAKDRLKEGEGSLYEIDLDVAGVTLEQRALMVTRSVGDWVIHTCSCCNCDAYLLHLVKEGDRVFVTKQMLSEAAAIRLLTQHPNYSQVFRIVLRPLAEDDQSFRRKRISSMTFGREDPVLKVAHSQMKSFLNQEEAAMERRIRRFEAEQREVFSALQKKAHEHRALLFTAIARARENGLSEAIGDAPAVGLAPGLKTTPPVVVGRTKMSPRISPEQQKVTITLRDTRPPLNKSASAPMRPRASPQPLDDTLFPLEGFEEMESEECDAPPPGLAFPQSDDEEISTDDSSYRDVSALNMLGIATSVPVSVPMFPRDKEQEHRGSGGEEFDPSRISNSIKALALSVQDTGMFGDLPKPRTISTPYAR